MDSVRDKARGFSLKVAEVYDLKGKTASEVEDYVFRMVSAGIPPQFILGGLRSTFGLVDGNKK